MERETQKLGGIEAGITQPAMGPGPLTQWVELYLALSLTGSQKVAAAIAIRHCTKASRRCASLQSRLSLRESSCQALSAPSWDRPTSSDLVQKMDRKLTRAQCWVLGPPSHSHPLWLMRGDYPSIYLSSDSLDTRTRLVLCSKTVF